MTTLRSGAASLVGQVRSANEDSYLVTDDLVAVADGMGGHRAGEVASADTVEVLRDAAGSRSVQDLVAAVHRANRRIHERAADDDALRGMGTTVCVAGLVRYDDREQVAVLNVGDSRAYLMADGELTRLTEDHSLVETLVREGRISAEEAEHHPQRNVITRALGVEPLVVVDAWLLEPVDGDRLLLCSDGLFGELGEDRIAELLAEDQDPEVVARRLAAEADAAGGRDNITTVVVDVVDSGSPPTRSKGATGASAHRRSTCPTSTTNGTGPRRSWRSWSRPTPMVTPGSRTISETILGTGPTRSTRSRKPTRARSQRSPASTGSRESRHRKVTRSRRQVRRRSTTGTRSTVGTRSTPRGPSMPVGAAGGGPPSSS